MWQRHCGQGAQGAERAAVHVAPANELAGGDGAVAAGAAGGGARARERKVPGSPSLINKQT
jgi:hypothetical protein